MVTLKRETSREYQIRYAALGVLFAVSVLACSAEPNRLGSANGTPPDSTPDPDGGAYVTKCTEGQTKSCSKMLARHGSILSCFAGTQTCHSGEWSDCADGSVRLTSVPLTGGERRLANLSQSPSGCRDNPCDPSCQTYQGSDGPIVAQLTTASSWWTGQIGDLPAAFQGVLSTASCRIAADCQSNQHCINVSTDTSCGHDKCEQGAGLLASCDPCVRAVCDQQPTCCDTAGAPACAAGELSDGAGNCFLYLETEQSWVNAQRACRAHGANWDLACITTQAQQALLRQATPTDSWVGLRRAPTGSGFTCVNQQTPLDTGLIPGVSPWNDGEPNDYGGQEDCVEIYRSEWGGLWNDLYCDYALLPAWCAGPAGSNSNWAESCVAAVAGTCGATCSPSGTVATGTCQAWNPGQSNANAASFDLSIDVPCGGTVPVCNHGTVAAPPGVVIHVFAADPALIGQTDPDLATELGRCMTDATIQPGTCVNVSGCSELLANDAVLWAQAPTGGESRTDDNWGYGQGGTPCTVPHCAHGGASEPCVKSRTVTDDFAGVCGASDGIPQWSYLQFRAITPGDSFIRFQAAAAPSAEELDTAIPVDLVTASVASGISNCLFSGPSPSCPVDLYRALLPKGMANSRYLRLTMTLVPSSDGMQSPVLDEWRINYACPDAT